MASTWVDLALFGRFLWKNYAAPGQLLPRSKMKNFPLPPYLPDRKPDLTQELSNKFQTEYLKNRLEVYEKKYKNNWQLALHMAWSSLLSVTKKHLPAKASAERAVAVRFEGGLGDLLIGINWACAFYEKFCRPEDIKIDFCFYNLNMLRAFSPAFVRRTLTDKTSSKERYDLMLTCMRCPTVEYINTQRMPKTLVDYAEKLNKFEIQNKELILRSMHADALTFNVLSSCKKRWHQPDIIDGLNLQEKFIVPFAFINERQVLDKFSLRSKKYITVSREVGDGAVTESTKLWPMSHYRKLLQLIKKTYPAYILLEVGTGKGDRIGNADMDLSGKTTLEEIKVLMKHAALHIDGEGGLVHLRHAVAGGPSCVFFGPSSPQVLGYSENINLYSKACPVCCEFYNPDWQKSCMRGQRVCMEKILPQQAFEAIKNNVSWRKS